MTNPDELRAKITDVDEQLRSLRGESLGLTRDEGGDNRGAQDEGDIAALLTNSEENAALISMLEQRRATLERQLDESG